MGKKAHATKDNAHPTPTVSAGMQKDASGTVSRLSTNKVRRSARLQHVYLSRAIQPSDGTPIILDIDNEDNGALEANQQVEVQAPENQVEVQAPEEEQAPVEEQALANAENEEPVNMSAPEEALPAAGNLNYRDLYICSQKKAASLINKNDDLKKKLKDVTAELDALKGERGNRPIADMRSILLNMSVAAASISKAAETIISVSFKNDLGAGCGRNAAEKRRRNADVSKDGDPEEE